MKIMVTGATGFVGRHVVGQLLTDGHSIVAVARDGNRARSMPWFDRVEFIACDLHKDFSPLLQPKQLPDVLVHLAWPGLPNYRDFFHISRNLPRDLAFLEAVVKAGVPQIMVSGTCLEYGIQHGPLSEETPTHPVTSYGVAKDTLRRSLEILLDAEPFVLQWMRIFYVYGEGQSGASLLSQLERVILEGKSDFYMSPGDQLRDYLPIETVAKYFSVVVSNTECRGIINCCSGAPISVYDLVKKYCDTRNKTINIIRGHYPYPDYEPLAFWGIPAKLQACIRNSELLSVASETKKR